MFVQKKILPLINLKGFILIIAGTGVGCAPLQQAPLVYTSSHVIGVKIGVAPTQPESLEAVIGYKDLDAAYAPVAVSNPYLDKAMVAGNRYDKDLYEIKEIYGIYGTQTSAAGASQLLTPEESADMKLYFDRFSAKQNTANDVVKNKEALEKAENLESLADQLQKELSSRNCKDFSDSKTLQEIIKITPDCIALESRSDFLTKYSELSDLGKTRKAVKNEKEKALKTYNNSYQADQAALKRLSEISEKVKGALEKLASIQKRDAISVYGSFDADTAATAAKGALSNDGSNGVSVKVGKVFSTGVAAQNVSEAQKIAASAVVVSACINAIGEQANKVYPGDSTAEDKRKFIQALVPECFNGKQDK